MVIIFILYILVPYCVSDPPEPLYDNVTYNSP